MDAPAAPEPASASEIGSPFKVPIYRAIWLAMLVSYFGGAIQAVGAAWMMTSLTRSPHMVAMVQSSVTFPIMMLALFAGAVADNLDRQRVMLGAQILMLTTSAGLTIAAWTGILTPWLLIVFTFLIGCGTAMNAPASQAAVGEMVPRALLPSAVALNSMSFNIARSVGPAIGGAIVAAAGAAVAFLANALSYFALIAVLVRWRPPIQAKMLPRERIGEAMVAGIRYAAMSPSVRVVLFRGAVFGLATSAISALMPLVARTVLHGGPLIYGVLLGAFGVGAIGGGLMTGPLRRRFSVEQTLRMAMLCNVLANVVVGLSVFLPLTVPALMIGGAGWVVALSTLNVTVQLSVPRWVVARGLALYQMCTFGGMAIGAWLFGSIAEDTGVQWALFAAGGLHVVGIILGLWLPLAPLEAINLDPHDWDEPDLALPIEGRSGPIVITISYRIAPANVATFLAHMNERRRIRRRDGARDWSLLRDLNAPDVWIERYHVPTWLDYVRHNRRRTVADTDNGSALLALHEGPGLPEIQRLIERQTGSLPTSRLPGAGEMVNVADVARPA